MFVSMSLRKQALDAFRQLHRTRKFVFAGDERGLAAAREKINSEFRKNMFETDASKINELITVAVDAEKFLRQTVVQAQEVEEGVYEVRITRDTALEDNTPFDAHAQLPSRRRPPKNTDKPS